MLLLASSHPLSSTATPPPWATDPQGHNLTPPQTGRLPFLFAQNNEFCGKSREHTRTPPNSITWWWRWSNIYDKIWRKWADPKPSSRMKRAAAYLEATWRMIYDPGTVASRSGTLYGNKGCVWMFSWKNFQKKWMHARSIKRNLFAKLFHRWV